ncbi:MAG: DsbA family protein, partial [Parahaliea sp.]
MRRWVNIDVYFDFVCPWCLIGKRQLEIALSELSFDRPDIEVNLTGRGFQLLPQIPAEGVAFADFYRRRLGSEQAVLERQRQVRQAAATVGVELDFSRIQIMPNTANAHRLFRHASILTESAHRDALLERMFAAYFFNGENLGSCNTLQKIARESALSTERIDRCLR